MSALDGAGSVLYDAAGVEIGQETNPLIVGPDYLVEEANNSTPNPSDWVTNNNNAPVGTDYDIRDTNYHYMRIPTLVSGYTRISFSIEADNYDQAVTFNLYGVYGSATNWTAYAYGRIATLTIPASITARGMFSGGGIGQGGAAGGSTMSIADVYAVPALDSPMPWWLMRFSCSVTPTAGALSLVVARYKG